MNDIFVYNNNFIVTAENVWCNARFDLKSLVVFCNLFLAGRQRK